MKNFIPALCIVSLFFSCNPAADHSKVKAKDSLQYLLNDLRDSIKKHPGEPRPWYVLALTLQNAGRYHEALSALDSMNTRPDSADPYLLYDYLFKKAELLEITGDTANAIGTLEKFVTPGELTEAGLRLAHLYAETKNPKTIPFCDLMIKNDRTGKDPNPVYLKGVYYYNTDDYSKAMAAFDECIQKDYTFIDAYMEKGRILFKQKNYTEAIKVYDLAITISNQFADAYLWKGRCQEALGQKQEAKLNYLRAFGLDKTLKEAKEAADKL